MPTIGSLSFTPPNLIYEGSSELRNLNFVVLSKESAIQAMSAGVPNCDSFSFSVEIMSDYFATSFKSLMIFYLGEIRVLVG